jgi:hypothetical protein
MNQHKQNPKMKKKKKKRKKKEASREAMLDCKSAVTDTPTAVCERMQE